MFRRGNEPFGPSEDVSDFHQVVVHYVSQMVRRVPVSFENHWISFMQNGTSVHIPTHFVL